MPTSVNRKRASQHHFYEIYMPYCHSVQNTFKRYLFSLFFDQNVIRLIQRIRISSRNRTLCWHFIGVYTRNRKLHGRFQIPHLSSRVEKYVLKLEDKSRISVRPCNILSMIISCLQFLQVSKSHLQLVASWCCDIIISEIPKKLLNKLKQRIKDSI